MVANPLILTSTFMNDPTHFVYSNTAFSEKIIHCSQDHTRKLKVIFCFLPFFVKQAKIDEQQRVFKNLLFSYKLSFREW